MTSTPASARDRGVARCAHRQRTRRQRARRHRRAGERRAQGPPAPVDGERRHRVGAGLSLRRAAWCAFFPARRLSWEAMGKLCERPGCSDVAAMAYGFDVDRLLVWLAPRDPGGDPLRAGSLCKRHADAMVVPAGWTLDDRREAEPRLFRPPPTGADAGAAHVVGPAQEGAPSRRRGRVAPEPEPRPTLIEAPSPSRRRRCRARRGTHRRRGHRRAARRRRSRRHRTRSRGSRLRRADDLGGVPRPPAARCSPGRSSGTERKR